MNLKLKHPLLVALLCAAASSFAASEVQSVDKPYVPGEASGAADAAAGQRQASPATDEKLVDQVIADNPVTKLVPGRSIATQLSAIAKKSGWTLIWDTSDFQLDEEVSVSTDIVKTVQTIVESANGLDTRLKAAFYRGNNVIRVTEY